MQPAELLMHGYWRLSMSRPNVIFLTVDQLASQVLSRYGGSYIETPNIEELAGMGVTFDNMISTCPVCTPYRSMWLTGRHPQTTGHVVNFMNTRHDEIGWGDVFSKGGYDTGYVGKWHLHKGSFPEIQGKDYVPEGRDRLGFRWWRGYNFHANYFNGTVNLDDWRVKQWEGYETMALNKIAFKYIDHERDSDKPFCLLINPHQPHHTPFDYAPEEYYSRLPKTLPRPSFLSDKEFEEADAHFRNYLAMVLAIDDMVGELLAGLEARKLLDNTLLVFTTDHGTHLGNHDENFWGKKMPWEENVRIPMVVYWAGVLEGGGRCDTLTAPVDLLPSFCSLCDISIPRTIEGLDLSPSWLGHDDSQEQEAVLLMNFINGYDYLDDGNEWRGVRTKSHTYARFLDGRTYLFDIHDDPFQENNLSGKDEYFELETALETHLNGLMEKRGDQWLAGSDYESWFDEQRRVIRNGYGPLSDPESEPDWSLM
jgi:arylsulfatase A-like enzyme